MITQIGHTCCQKQVGHPKSLSDKCDLLGSLLVIFFSVVEFILLRYFFMIVVMLKTKSDRKWFEFELMESGDHGKG